MSKLQTLSLLKLHIIIILFLTTCIDRIYAQQEDGLNVVSIEFAGKGLVYSLNYERLFKWKNNSTWHSVSLGYAGITVAKDQHAYFFPLSYNKLFSKRELHWFEMGMVMSPVLLKRLYDTPYGPRDFAQWLFFPGITLGYRKHIFESFSWVFKINGYIYFLDYFPSRMIPYLGVTFGKAF